jgi:hypothetical protein
MTTTTFWERGLSDYWLMFCPCFRFNVKGMDIRESVTCIVKTTVASIDPKLAVVITSTSVSSWSRCLNNRLLVYRDSFITENTCPDKFLATCSSNFEPPTIVKSVGWACMTSINEDAIKLRGC